MALNDGDILEIRSFATYQGQVVQNVYYQKYTAVTTIPTYTQVLEEFRDRYIQTQLALLSNTFLYAKLDLSNLTNNLDESTISFNLVGTKTGEALPLFNSMSLKLNREFKITRSGGKRYSGITEADTVGGLFNTGVVTAWQNWGNAAFTDHDVDGDPTLGFIEPYLIGRFPSGAYDLTKQTKVDSVTARNIVSTQNTRKIPFPTI